MGIVVVVVDNFGDLIYKNLVSAQILVVETRKGLKVILCSLQVEHYPCFLMHPFFFDWF